MSAITCFQNSPKTALDAYWLDGEVQQGHAQPVPHRWAFSITLSTRNLEVAWVWVPRRDQSHTRYAALRVRDAEAEAA